MKWENNRESNNVDDRRASRASFGSGGGANIARFLPIVKTLIGTKIGRIVLVVGVVLYFVFNINPLTLLDGGSVAPQQVKDQVADDKSAKFSSVILAQTEDVWREIFRKNGMKYSDATMVLFRGGVDSGCGFASSQVGPFYCPADNKLYLDLSFFDELAKKYKAPGDLAQAYVIAHEVGHHIQNLTGVLTESQRAKQGKSQTKQNAIQVGVELQADCYAGMWAKHSDEMFGSLEDGDLDSALAAANAIGDDTLQKQYQGHVVPDSFTHGTSAQRKAAFMRGFNATSMKECSL